MGDVKGAAGGGGGGIRGVREGGRGKGRVLGMGYEGGRKKGDDFGFCEEGTGVPRMVDGLPQTRQEARVHER